MLSKLRGSFSSMAFAASLLTLGLVLGLPASLAAEESAPAATEASKTQELPSSLATKVYQVNGVTISWNADARRFEAPTPEQMAKISEAFAEMATEGVGKVGPNVSEKAQIKKLENGLSRARLPLHLMSASVVKVDEHGHFVSEHCVDSGEAQAVLDAATEDVPAGEEQ